jgi:hypothetical protein
MELPSLIAGACDSPKRSDIPEPFKACFLEACVQGNGMADLEEAIEPLALKSTKETQGMTRTLGPSTRPHPSAFREPA